MLNKLRSIIKLILMYKILYIWIKILDIIIIITWFKYINNLKLLLLLLLKLILIILYIIFLLVLLGFYISITFDILWIRLL
jgi:hypothetical protein